MKHTYRRRGRPSASYDSKDLGTPELIAKRAFGLTSEPLDICLERKLINRKEHYTGMWLRFLHSIHFGVPHVCAYEFSYQGKSVTSKFSLEWLAEREQEYHQAIALLERKYCRKIVTSVCIFQQPPSFLLHNPRLNAFMELQQLQEGLAVLLQFKSRLVSS